MTHVTHLRLSFCFVPSIFSLPYIPFYNWILELTFVSSGALDFQELWQTFVVSFDSNRNIVSGGSITLHTTVCVPHVKRWNTLRLNESDAVSMDSLLRLMVGHMYDGVYWWWPFELKTSLVSSVGWINGIILYIFLNPKVKNQKKTIKLTLLLER